MKKRGELTTQQIVGLIILIASFSVILFLIFRLNLGETTDKEICHNSVLMKSKSVLGGSLDCKTNYVCISGGGKCEGIEPAITVDIDLNKPNAKNETMKAIADEMADCWWMFGEGKIDYEGEDWKGYHCAICSIVKFDDKVQEKFSEITYDEFYNFLIKPKDKTQTYLKYLYNVNLLDDVKPKLEVKKFKFGESILTKEKYSVLTGINPDWPSEDSFVYPSFVKSSEVKNKTECDVFDITKA